MYKSTHPFFKEKTEEEAEKVLFRIGFLECKRGPQALAEVVSVAIVGVLIIWSFWSF